MNELYAAIASHDLDRLARSLSNCDLTQTIVRGISAWGPLHDAINEIEDGGPVDALVLLLRAGAPIEQRTGVGATGDTPLLMAVYRRSIEAVRVLLAAGADPCVVGSEGDSPLRSAAGHGDLEIARLLLRCGANATVDEPGGILGQTALAHAATHLDTDMLDLLLQHGARVDARDRDGLKALDWMPERTAKNAKRWDATLQRIG